MKAPYVVRFPYLTFKPSQMDRADICYYSEDSIKNGTIPNKIIELKNRRAGKNEILQIVRYVKWIRKLLPDDFEKISFYLFAPDFTRNIGSYVPREIRDCIEIIPFQGQKFLI